MFSFISRKPVQHHKNDCFLLRVERGNYHCKKIVSERRQTSDSENNYFRCRLRDFKARWAIEKLNLHFFNKDFVDTAYAITPTLSFDPIDRLFLNDSSLEKLKVGEGRRSSMHNGIV